MLNPEDRRAIEDLFSRLAEAARRNPDRDPEAEELIRREMGRQPGAPYYLAQTVVVQAQALEAAERRIEELEQQAQRRRSPWDRADAGDQRNDGRVERGFGGGGFLGGAMQTALGVAGGVLLGSAIGSLLGAGGAHASESQPADQPDQGNDSGQDQGQDTGNDAGDAGGDWGDFGGDGGGFDMGGDF